MKNIRKTTLFAAIALATLATLSAGFTTVQAADYKIPATWAELKASAGDGTEGNNVEYVTGMNVMWCRAGRGNPDCRVAVSPPTELDCASTATASTQANWRWVNQTEEMPNIVVMIGDGTATCHGRVVPRGQYWAVNQAYQAPAKAK